MALGLERLHRDAVHFEWSRSGPFELAKRSTMRESCVVPIRNGVDHRVSGIVVKQWQLASSKCPRPASAAARQQHETELARLREIESGAHRCARVAAEHPAQSGDQRRFEAHEQHAVQTHPEQAGEHQPHIQLHADRHEEKSEQHVPERFDVAFDLVAVLGFRDQHAGDERAEGERQSGSFGDNGHDRA